MRTLLPLAALSLLAVGCTGGGDGNDDGFTVIVDPDLPDAELEAQIQQDRHSQVGVPAVDVLWVVDNSRSMYEEQQFLVNNFTSFMKSFEASGMDYHIAVMSTGFDDEDERGKFRTSLDQREQVIRWIDPDTRDPEEVFREMALIGIDGPDGSVSSFV